jgi:thiamine-phosphate pyrophosphorylase
VEAICERLGWWAELFEPPCVGHAESLDEVRLFAAAGADFVLVGDIIWQDSRGPEAALAAAGIAIAQGFATATADAAAGPG